MVRTDPGYIPALRFRILMPLYDPLLKWGMREQAFKRQLIARAALEPGQDARSWLQHLTLMLRMQRRRSRAGWRSEVLDIAQRQRSDQHQLGSRHYDLPYPDSS
jgi:hypothetical protein